MGFYIKDQRQADFNRCSDIFTRLGVEKSGRRRVGKAYARLWNLPSKSFKDLICQYDYGLIVDLVEAPMNETEEEKHIRLFGEYGAYNNPLLKYILLDETIRLEDIRSR